MRIASECWNVLPQELSIAEGPSPRAVYPNDVLVELADFNDHCCLIPFCVMGPSVNLDADLVTCNKGRKMSAIVQLGILPSLYVCCVEPPLWQEVFPSRLDGVHSVRMNRNDWAAKQALGGGKLNLLVWCVSLLEHCTLECISV